MAAIQSCWATGLKLLILLIAISSSNAVAQRNVIDSVELELENPTGFLAPGQSQQLYMRVTNPADSGITVLGLEFHSRPSAVVNSLTPQQSIVAFQRSDLCDYPDSCAVSGQLPLQPGESMLVTYFNIFAWEGNEQENIPTGSVISGTAIQFSLQTDQGDAQAYSRNKFVYIVSEDGTGDPAEFDQYMIDLPPLVIPKIDFELEYPEVLAAGENFNLLARITNTGSVAISPITLSSVQVSSGVPAGVFHYNRCQSFCYYALSEGGVTQQTGESTTLNLGNFYYDHDQLTEKDYEIESIVIRVFDPELRSFELSAGSPALQIHVTPPPGGDTVNPVDRLPDREAFQYRGLVSPDDYRLVRDPNTGFDWIRLDASEPIPVPEMIELLDDHPLFEGFEVARISQVEQLVLNYVHSLGIEATGYQLRNPGPNLNQALFSFLDAIGRTYGPLNFPVPNPPFVETGGAVIDKPALTTSFEWPMTIAWIRAYRSFIPSHNPGHGLNQRVNEIGEKDSLSIGYWLVRTNQAPLNPPAGAKYYKEELILPRVKVGDTAYYVTMNFRNEVTRLLQITELIEQSNPSAGFDAVFDEETGILDIPALRVQTEADGFASHHVRLEFVEEFDLFNFRILSIE